MTNPDSPPEPLPLIEVAIGLIWREGRLLITRRPAGVHLAGLWEFPGGKREPGESAARCLAREVAEELGIEIAVGEEREVLAFTYPDRRVELRAFDCAWRRGEPRARGCAEWRWVLPADLAGYEFPPANGPLLARLSNPAD
jgi:8-oxo-dGTP diphosphatase